MTLNYRSILTLKNRFFTAVIYHGKLRLNIFITLAPGGGDEVVGDRRESAGNQNFGRTEDGGAVPHQRLHKLGSVGSYPPLRVISLKENSYEALNIYHVVILLLKLGSNKRVNKTQIHSSK
jgi:hypothetical protein